MAEIGGGIGLPTMSQREMFEQLLGDDESRNDSEPEIAAAIDRKSTRLNSSHSQQSRMPSSA